MNCWLLCYRGADIIGILAYKVFTQRVEDFIMGLAASIEAIAVTFYGNAEGSSFLSAMVLKTDLIKSTAFQEIMKVLSTK